jgi:glycerol-3-phosphate acyltransferase PlsY
VEPVEIAVVAAAYLLGSIPFGVIFYWLFRRGDVRAVGSRNIGATNVARTAGVLPGLLTLVFDILKGYAAVALCFAAGLRPDSWVIAAAALFALLGHMFPLWLLFKGGKGIATGLGVFVGLAWHVALLALLIFIVFVLITRIVSLSSLLATAAFVIMAFALGPWLGITLNLQVGAVLSAILIFLRHHENITRLLAGTEKRFGLAKQEGRMSDEGAR